MSNPQDSPVSKLTPDQCWDRLKTQRLGRIVTSVGDVIDIFPISYVVDGESVVFRTAEGAKLNELAVNSSVLFEVDEVTTGDAWSVIIRGSAARLQSEQEIAWADELPLTPHVPTLKRNFVRITPENGSRAITGIAFSLGDEPERTGVTMYE